MPFYRLQNVESLETSCDYLEFWFLLQQQPDAQILLYLRPTPQIASAWILTVVQDN